MGEVRGVRWGEMMVILIFISHRSSRGNGTYDSRGDAPRVLSAFCHSLLCSIRELLGCVCKLQIPKCEV